MLKRSQVRQFLAVVDAGSFTQAAARIRVTQPTLSAGIAQLEREVGAKVFVRDRRSVRLTETGAKLLPIAREIEKNFASAGGLASSSRDEWPGLRLGVLNTIAAPVLAKALHALRAGSSVELVDGTAADLRKALTTGRIQLALTLANGDEACADHAFPLMTEPYVMFVSAGHRLARAGRIGPMDLAGEIMIARRSCEVLGETSRYFTQHGIRPRFSLRSANDERCMAMVAAGAGITTAPLSFGSEAVSPVELEGYGLSRCVAFVANRDWLGAADHAARVQEVVNEMA